MTLSITSSSAPIWIRHRCSCKIGSRSRFPYSRRCAADRRDDEKAIARHHDGRASRFAGWIARSAFYQQLRLASDSRRARAARRRGRHQCLRRARIFDAIWLDPHQLSARGLTAQDVVTAIQEQNVQVAAGIIGAPPVPRARLHFNTPLARKAGSLTKNSSATLLLRPALTARSRAWRDIARVELAARDYTVNSGLGGNRRRRLRFSNSRVERARHVRCSAQENG